MDGLLDESFNRETDRYLLSVMAPPDGVLAKMEQYALTKKFPFIGPLAGNLLGVLARATGAQRVFELGSGFGYSALQFARCMPPDGRVICTDGDPENKARAEKYFADAGMSAKLDFARVTRWRYLRNATDRLTLFSWIWTRKNIRRGFARHGPRCG